MLTFSNSFHGTTFASSYYVGRIVTRSYVAKVQAHLCGVPGCTCGGNGGVRGGEAYFEPFDAEGNKFMIMRHEDGAGDRP